MTDTDIYPVGLFHDVQQFRRGVHQPHALQRLRYDLRYPLRQARAGHWRAVKNYFNGYLAEPPEFPPGVTRCGSGWTRKRALSDYERRARRAAR
jgi:hypothetical protein